MRILQPGRADLPVNLDTRRRVPALVFKGTWPVSLSWKTLRDITASKGNETGLGLSARTIRTKR
jgi:hypothetical protein